MKHPSASHWSTLAIAIVLLFSAASLATEPVLKSPEIEVTLWAKQPMLRNPVGISHDPQGRIYATEANRRKSADLDVRNMNGLTPIPWPAIDYSIQSVDQRREVIREYLAPNSPYSNPWLKDYDGDGQKNWRDLLAKTERVNLLEDTDGDGKADKATVFAEGFNTEVTGTAGDVLWFDNNVYLTVIPDLWLLNDDDGDGVAERRESLITGHGVHIGQGGHDLHGLTVGPDGRIYWSVGDKGINITSKEGRQFKYPNQGIVMRSEPDGSNFEVFAHGLRNCMELAFDDFGNLFCVDNDGDFKGERERFLYVTRDSDTGWRINWQYNHTDKWAAAQGLPDYNPWMEEKLYLPHFEGQAAYITPPLSNYSDGPAGFIRNPGTALSEEYRDYFFLTQFPGQKITAFKVKPRGAAFEMVDEHLFQGGFMATGMSFGPDGALYVADWSGNWEPTEDGGIFKLDVKSSEQHPLRRQTQQLIQEGMSRRNTDSLLLLLSYPDQRVRLSAQFELAGRNASEKLTQTALDKNTDLQGRVHALWALGQIARGGKLTKQLPIADLLSEANAQIKIQTCRIITDAPLLFREFEQSVIDLLDDPDLSVRFHAAQTLGAIGTSEHAIEPLFDLLASEAGSDPFIRHGAVTGLAGIGDGKQLAAARSNPSNSVRLGAVLAMKRLALPEITLFLDDTDPLVVLEAARSIHDDFGIRDALPALATLLNQTPHVENEALMRRVLNANLRIGEKEQFEAVLQFYLSGKGEKEIREEAMKILHVWSTPAVLDRVERRYRALPARDPEMVRSTLQTNLAVLLGADAPAGALSLLSHYNIPLDAGTLQQRLGDASLPATERIEILRVLAGQSKQQKAAFKTAFASEEDQLRMEALNLLVVDDTPAAVKRIQELLTSDATRAERQHAITMLGEIKEKSATALLQNLVDDLRAGNAAREEQLDIYLAASKNGGFEDTLQTLQQQASRDAQTPSEFLPVAFLMYGGNASKGQQVFLQHPAAQCIRCHAVGQGEGSTVGPNLADIGNKVDRAYLVESLIEPSAKLAEGFDNAAAVSVMPPMGGLLTPEELRDVVAYLASLKD